MVYGEGIGKPDSVPRLAAKGNDHSSGPDVAGGIVRPYPRALPGRTARLLEAVAMRREPSYLVLLRMGFVRTPALAGVG